MASYPFDLERPFVEGLRAEALGLVADIDQMILPDYDGPRARPDALAAFAAREWRRIAAFDHALGAAPTSAAMQAASYAVRVLPRVSAMTPGSFFEWFGIAFLANSTSLVNALCSIDLSIFNKSGAVESPATIELAVRWQREISLPGARDGLEYFDFDRALAEDRLNLEHVEQVLSLWRATEAAFSKNPDAFEASVKERARNFDRRASDLEERYVADALLDFPLTALVIQAQGRSLRIPLQTPYVAKRA